MSNDVYPNEVRGLGFTVKRYPEFNTLIHTGPSFSETRIMQARNPRWHWELKYNYLKDMWTDLATSLTWPDLRVLLGFICDHGGQWDDWLYYDVDDHFIGPAMIDSTPNSKAQLQKIQDGNTGTWYSPIQRSLGGLFLEDITDLKGTADVYANGTKQDLNDDYHIHGPGLAIPGYSFVGKYVEWVAEPTAPVTIETDYYFRCRFESDMFEMEKFMNELWGSGGDGGGAVIKFMTTRAYS